jgi:hypothetical protein
MFERLLTMGLRQLITTKKWVWENECPLSELSMTTRWKKRKENETFTGPECVWAATTVLRLGPIDVNWKQSLFDGRTRTTHFFVLFVWTHNLAFHRGPPNLVIVDVFVFVVHLWSENCNNQEKESKVMSSHLCDIWLDIKPTANNRNVGGAVWSPNICCDLKWKCDCNNT